MQKKIMYSLSAGIISLLALSGCRSKEMPKQFTHVPVYVAAQQIPADDQNKIRSNPVMRAYAIGRYVDPNRKSVMHEQHTIYREEQSPRWNLIPQPDADPVLMAQKQRQERYADALSGQIALASKDMRDTRNMVRSVLDSQTSQDARNRELLQALEELKKRYTIVSGNLVKSSNYIIKLETEIHQLKKETELLKLQPRSRRGDSAR